MIKRILSTLLVVTSSLSFVSCGKKQSLEESARRVPTPKSYDKSLCQVQPEDGDSALYQNLQLDDVSQDPFFRKSYDRSDLDAVLASSAIETANYVMKMGVNLFQVPESDGCATYYSLDVAPDPLLQQWELIAGSGGEGLLAGIYFENCAPPCAERQVINPTIMVRETSDRWTLVHEMMHHNFNLQRKLHSNAPGLPQIRLEIERGTSLIESLLKDYANNRNEATLNQLINEADSLIESLYKLLLQTNFEEMSVESLLLAKFSAGDFKNIPAASAQSAAWYISFSRKDAMRRFETLEDLLRNFAKEADQLKSTPAARNIQKARQKIAIINTRAQDVENDANNKISRLAIPTITQSRWMTSFKMVNAYSNHLENIEGYDQLKIFDEALTRIHSYSDSLGN